LLETGGVRARNFDARQQILQTVSPLIDKHFPPGEGVRIFV
jgi:hypothetical protein